LVIGSLLYTLRLDGKAAWPEPLRAIYSPAPTVGQEGKRGTWSRDQVGDTSAQDWRS
jgi:hypothetical protein